MNMLGHVVFVPIAAVQFYVHYIHFASCPKKMRQLEKTGFLSNNKIGIPVFIGSWHLAPFKIFPCPILATFLMAAMIFSAKMNAAVCHMH
jgi:hypothetical protein